MTYQYTRNNKMKTVNDLIVELRALRPELKEKPIVCYAQNGVEFEAKIKFLRKDHSIYQEIEKIVITH